MKKQTIAFLFILISSAALGQREYHVSTLGNDDNLGTLNRPLKTITSAAHRAQPGDTITVHKGVYRELVSPPRGGTSEQKRITYRAAAGEKVEIRGSEQIRGWKRTGSGSWSVVLSDQFFGGTNPYKEVVFGDWFFPGRLKIHTGEVYLNGKPLSEATATDSIYTWSAAGRRDSTIITANFGHVDPNVSLVEINVRPACFYPERTGVNYISVQGFHMSQAATQWAAPTAEQVGLIGTNWSKGWIISGNTVSDSKCVGIALGKDRASGHNVWSADMEKDGALRYSEMIQRVIALGWGKENIGSHLVSGNRIFRCGQAGICGSFGAVYSIITGNQVHDIYTRRSFGGAEMAGIKLHGAIDVLISDNKIYNAFIGIWLDWMAQGTRVSGNQLYGNDYVDFFPEVNHGPFLVDNNSFGSAFSLRDWSEGGAYVFNTFRGKLSRAAQNRSTPWFKAHSTIWAGTDTIRGGDNRFIGNTFYGSTSMPVRPKMHPWDSEDLISGYGLGLYNGVAQPVLAQGNRYIAGAATMSGEKQISVSSISLARLGRTLRSGQGFSDPVGKTITITRKRQAKGI